MTQLYLEDVREFVNEHIVEFHRSRLQSLENLALITLLKRKNPYLFRAKNIIRVQDLADNLLDAHLSSSEEELFGQFLEKLAIFIAQKLYGGYKSERVGIDLELVRDKTYALIQIKSGTNWGNSSQQKQEENFRQAVQDVRRELASDYQIQPVLGICYGKTRTAFLRGYLKLVGQNFWYYISGNEQLYKEIIEPIGYRAKEHTEAFANKKTRISNLLTQELMNGFCENGIVDWEKIVELNSGNFDLPNFLAKQAPPERS